MNILHGGGTKFRPSIVYPEYPWKNDISETPNCIYDSVRESLHLLALDEEHWNTPEWNPLHDFVPKNGTVLIKPNLVMDKNRNPDGGEECLYTQPSVVAPVIDYVILAAGKQCKIIVGDAPMQECKWNTLIHESGYYSLIEWYRKHGIDIHLVDFRELTSENKNGLRIQSINEQAKGKIVDLAKESEFAGLSQKEYESFRVTNYDPSIMKKHHNENVNEYYISQYVLDADLIINMPKPKSHRKAGVTISLKNFVGINVRKEFLPHHSMSSVAEGGDEYLNKNSIHHLRSKLYDYRNFEEAHKKYALAWIFQQMSRACSLLLRLNKKDPYSEGSWYGNHTISRTISDLNKVVLYADSNGALQDKPVRRMLIVGDMIISGEKEGPVCPTPKEVGIIAAGTNTVCFDEAIAGLMGFDIKKIPSIINARNVHGKYRLVAENQSPVLKSNIANYNNKFPQEVFSRKTAFNFIPTSGWKGHIELE